MPDDFQMLTFTLDETIETAPPRTDSEDTTVRDKGAADILNRQADSMAKTIEREVRRLFPSAQIVQADISFFGDSSIELLCTVIVGGLGSIISTAVGGALSQGLQEGLKQAVGSIIRRVVRGPLASNALTVQPLRGTSITLQSTSPVPPTSALSPEPSLLQRVRQSTATRDASILMIINAALLLVILIIQVIFLMLMASRATAGQRRWAEHRGTEVIMAASARHMEVVYLERAENRDGAVPVAVAT